MNKNHNSLPIAPLFVPGNRQDMLNKVINMDVEWVIPDLEDSVPLSEKEYARDITKKSIINLINSGKKIIPRINSFSTSYFLDDLESLSCKVLVSINCTSSCSSCSEQSHV